MSQIGTNKDIPIKITVQNTAGEVIDIGTFSNIEVAIYQKKENIIQEFTGAQVETIVAADGTIRVRLDRANTAKLNTINPLYIEVVPYTTDANFEGGIRKWNVSVIKLPGLTFSAK